MNILRAEITQFPRKSHLKVRDKLIDLSRPQILGIINITPDSFYSPSRHLVDKKLLDKVEQMLKEGADIIDIGALSTRPGAKLISVKEEKLRLLPALRNIKKHFPNTILSVDTFRGSVARACIDEGIDIINDIGGLQMDEEMFDVISKNNVAYILMHGANSFNTMHKTNEDTDIFRDISLFFSRQLNKLIESGQTEVILDPGFGFGKTLDQNYTLLNQLNMLHIFGFPILVGVSRKSMIWKRLGIDSENALNGTTCLNTIALLNGASFFRVHDVREMKEIIQLTETIP